MPLLFNLPSLLYLLALAVFAQATSEFMLSGLTPEIATDLAVSIPTAGWLTSAFALGMVVGAPTIAVLGRRWPRRLTLLVTLTVFLLAHVVGALADDFTLLLITRLVAALANAGFLAVALATASTLVEAKGRATAVLLAGTTLACIAGVPAGAWLGQHLGWRSAFWAVALICLPALVAIFRSIPSDRITPYDDAPADATQPPVARLRPSARLVVLLALGALVNGATFCTFTYLAPILTEVTGLDRSWIPALLMLFGLGSFAGVTLAGRYADRQAHGVLAAAGVALLLGWCLFASTAQLTAAAVALVFVQGLLSFAVGSTLISLALYAGAESPVLAGGLATAALNVGAVLGPVAGGIGITLTGDRAPLWCSAILVAAALLTALVTSTRTTVQPRPDGPADALPGVGGGENTPLDGGARRTPVRRTEAGSASLVDRSARPHSG
ncbi:DHA1 family chloramphenicol resistance protein-like MFS transporter [Kribbella italica]|uniref:DHA1 family chloramphenicol resistance protein-like MFS transporter n=1 Tax=Kribbella italica TaxID=1540520 RepID=A0A7W9JEK8_9ACTN|nr:Cmx/CmrA family chloramphenicol efflux MFS transporter [Kribbella italica]MBB5840731.1 DHA1 family chloramphenicol resistance protein-like MFS transporter [Kribbella italica]